MDSSPNTDKPKQWVEIAFDCLPLRSVQRVDVPLDASPKYEAFVLAVKSAIETHGTHNTYFLHNATCVYRFTNDPLMGMVRFAFHGTVLTDESDCLTKTAHLDVRLDGETCDWLNESVVRWLEESVRRSVMVEFNRYIQAGDLTKTRQRIEQMQAQVEADDGYLGMYL